MVRTVLKTQGNVDDREYAGFINKMSRRLADMEGPLFKTDVDLWPVYLDSFKGKDRQYHDCSTCRAFFCRYGGLVTVSEDGSLTPAFWHVEDAPRGYMDTTGKLYEAVRRSKITGVFLSNDLTLGTAVTDGWRHYAVACPSFARHTSYLKTPGQAAAEKLEDFKNVSRALAEFPLELIDQAVSLLKVDALYRSEKVLGPVLWLRDLHTTISDHRSHRQNIIWKYVAVAPAGFCHPRSSMAGSLLEDLAAGLPLEDVRKRFAAKMHPLQYQRPQAAPKVGNIARAEDIVAKLGIERSLERRFARIEECQLVWEPKKTSYPGGVFGHLKKSKTSPGAAVAGNITWKKFAETVLPGAVSMEVLVPLHGNFCGLVTATHEDAPPIIQWDLPEQRNPVSWYIYHRGSSAGDWKLTPRQYATVTGITLQPSMWNGGFEHQGQGVIFLIEDAKDQRSAELCLFPEILKSELREVRSVIEAHSRSRKITGYEDASACGLKLHAGTPTTVRVTDKSGVSIIYNVDRWD